MKAWKRAVLPLAAMAAMTGCSFKDMNLGRLNPFSWNDSSRPPEPSHPIPAGTVRIEFTRKVQAPVFLTLDGTVVPVEPIDGRWRKKARAIVITGLSKGPHVFMLASNRYAFSPDQGLLDVTDTKGTFVKCLSQELQAEYYGKADKPVSSKGLPGVKAMLVRK